MAYSSHVSAETNATEVEQSVDFVAQYLDFLSNDGEEPIIVNFDASTTRPNAVRLNPGEVLYGIERQVKILYFRSLVGVQPFRAMGMT